tara:strand:- start:393 stop:1466 length:1074 start_codon:yes stop_codon:yes gene_type:complete
MLNLIRKNKKNILYFLSVFCSTTTIILFYSFSIETKKVNLEPGFMKSSAFKDDGILCKLDPNGSCMREIFDDFKLSKKNILFFGNSQTGAVNKFKKNDISYVSILKNEISKRNKKIPIRGIWFPNANLVEYNQLNNLIKNCDIDNELLVIPVFLDDMREQGIRDSIKQYKEQKCFSNNLSETIKKYEFGNLEISNNKIKEKVLFLGKLEALNKHLRLHIYKLRNFVFNIKPESIRGIKTIAYNENISALKNILEERTINSSRTIVYIPPLLHFKSKKNIPYDHREYKKFKTEIANLCKKYACNFYNLETIVPDKFWGLKSSTSLFKGKKEIDFMHFTSTGHQIIADEFIKILSAYEI